MKEFVERNSHDPFGDPGKNLEFFMYFEFVRVARETRSSTPHHFESRCFVRGLPQELVLAGQLAKTLSCPKISTLLFQSEEKSRFFVLFRDIYPSSSVFDRLDFRSRTAPLRKMLVFSRQNGLRLLSSRLSGYRQKSTATH